jgi:hypothetical protein
MFNPDFYPTPPEVAATMLDPLDLRGKVLPEKMGKKKRGRPAGAGRMA